MNVCKTFKLLLVMSATNAVSEDSFSVLSRVILYLQSTVTQQRLNHLMVLHNKDLTDKNDIILLANKFVAQWEHRSNIFDMFREANLV